MFTFPRSSTFCDFEDCDVSTLSTRRALPRQSSTDCLTFWFIQTTSSLHQKTNQTKKRLVSKQQFHFSVSGLILVKSSSNHDDDCCVTYHKRSYPENKTTSKKSDIQILCRDKHWRKKRVASSTPLWLRLISRRHLGPHLAAAGSRVQWHWLRKIYCNSSRYNPSPRFMVAPRHVVGFAV